MEGFAHLLYINYNTLHFITCTWNLAKDANLLLRMGQKRFLKHKWRRLCVL